MRRNAFTLIELLAVIVILAIIALIAVPIVINIINDSKLESQKRSIDIYMASVQKIVERYQMENPMFKPSECEINGRKLICGDTALNIDMNGETPENGIVIINDSKIYYRSVLLNGKYYSNVATLLDDVDKDGKISIGDKYSYNVNGKDIFNFYVLSIEEDKVNLIMDRNICGLVDASDVNNGKPADNNNTCLIAWHRDVDDNNYGPDTAMTGVYNATKKWINVPYIVINYYDLNDSDNTIYGYESIMTNTITKQTTIIGINNKTSQYQTFGNLEYPLRARLPKKEEVISSETGCVAGTAATCSIWLVENLKAPDSWCNICRTKYAETHKISNINGYWLLSSYSSQTRYSLVLDHNGGVGNLETSDPNDIGIRPVITVSVTDLSQ